MTKRFVLRVVPIVALLHAGVVGLVAQSSDAVEIGERRSIHSEILDEDRAYNEGAQQRLVELRGGG